jgi:hypothetical protein
MPGVAVGVSVGLLVGVDVRVGMGVLVLVGVAVMALTIGVAVITLTVDDGDGCWLKTNSKATTSPTMTTPASHSNHTGKPCKGAERETFARLGAGCGTLDKACGAFAMRNAARIWPASA